MIPRQVTWICKQCAVQSGAWLKPYHLATYHEDVCGVCKQTKDVTEPRDFWWPEKR